MAPSREHGRPSGRLDEHVTCDAATQRDLRPVDVHEEGPAERAAARQPDGVAGVDAEIIQPSLEAVPSPDVEHARFVSRPELVERHSL